MSVENPRAVATMNVHSAGFICPQVLPVLRDTGNGTFSLTTVPHNFSLDSITSLTNAAIRNTIQN